MVDSSFYGDTPNYATDYPTQNDGNTNPVAGNTAAPSSFYPNGGIYEELANSDDVLAAAAASAAAAAASATGAASSATASAASAAAAAATGTLTPLMDGTAAVGTSTHGAHEDHVHPTDTSRAPLASPALTGTPTAPTAAPGTNTTQLATTAYVLANGTTLGSTTPLMDGTGAAGVAVVAAHADHVHPTDTSRAPLASPALTGTPTAPTATLGDNSTTIATTAFVRANGGGSGSFSQFEYTATAGQTTFSGTDINGNSLVYSVGFVEVFLNGTKLNKADFTATSGTSVVLPALALSDQVTMVAYAFNSLALLPNNNLSDVSNAATARTNLGAAPTASPTLTGTVGLVTDTLNFGTAVAGGLATFTWAGGTGANAGTREMSYKGGILKWQRGMESAIFGGGSTSDNYVLYNQAVGKALTVQASDSAVIVGSTTAASGTTSGALVVSGGAGFAGDVYCAGMKAIGYACRTGLSGSFSGSAFNSNWTGSALQCWVDATNLGTFNITSDYRIKKDVTDYTGSALDEINQWRTISYTGKAWGVYENNDKVRHSFIAHELQAISPDCVVGEKDGEQPQSLDLVPIITRLAKAVQELSAELTAIKASITKGQA